MTTTKPEPSTTRTVLRVGGVIFLVGGLTAAITGGVHLGHANLTDPSAPGPGFSDFLPLVAGMFATILGLGLLNAGFLGLQSRYVSGQTAPAVREMGMAFRGDRGDRSDGSNGAGRTGAFCSDCGARTNPGARFCDACGHGLA